MVSFLPAQWVITVDNIFKHFLCCTLYLKPPCTKTHSYLSILSASFFFFLLALFSVYFFSPSQRKGLCVSISSEQMSCQSPQVEKGCRVVRVWFEMDNVHVDFESIKGTAFTYQADPELYPLNREDQELPIRFKPGGVLAVEVSRRTKKKKRNVFVETQFEGLS